MSENNRASVYVHINLINGKKYFGITTNEPERRWRNGYGYYNNAHFKNAILKYGWNNFAHYVLYRDIPIKIAKNIEETLIDEHMSYDRHFGYNKTYGGELERHTKESRQKISDSRMGEKNPMYGKHHSNETRQKMRENNPMKRQEVAVKSRESLKAYFKEHPEANKGENNPMYGKHHTKEVIRKLSKPVEAIDPEAGCRVHYFESAKSAGRAGFDDGCICKCCKGKQKTHKGYIWRYVKEVSDNDSDN